MRLLRALVAVVLLPVLAGCTSDEPGPDDPSATWSPTGQIETPTGTSSAVVEPVLPDAATEASEEGARAFIEYYWELINYAQATGDVSRLRSVSGATCAGCTRAIDAVTDLYSGGGHVEGGDYTLTIRQVKDVSPQDNSLYSVEAALVVRNTEQVIHHNDGTQETSGPKDSSYLCYLIWVDGAWRTDILEPR